MLEKLVSNMITSYLGKYIENLDRKNVSVSLWSGQVDLKDLYVRQSALRGMNLPISVKEGKIGSLKVRIPWTRLQSEPIVFNISDLVIILHPKSAAQYDEEAEEEEQLAYKREQLEALEHMRQAGLTDAAAASAKTEPSPNSYDEDDQDESSAQHQKKVAALEKAKDNSFTSRIKASMLSNAQLELRNIVIMYEDLITDPTQPVHFTIRIDGLSAQSSTADDRPTFANPSDRFLYKLLQCENFRVGVEMAKHMGRSATAGKSIKDILTQFQSTGKPTTAAASPPSSSDLGGFTEEQCLVSPTNFSLRLQHQPIPYEVTVPRWLATAKIPEAQVRVDRQQWDCVWRSVKYVERYEDIKFFFRFRPSGSSQWTPQLRWNFAIQSTLYVVRKQLNKGKFNWNDYIEKKRLQTEYIDLFRRSQPEASEWALALSKEEVPRLTVIEKVLPLEMLRTARNLAFARIDLEKIQYEKKVQYNARLEAVREKKLQKAKQAGGTATGNSSNSTGKVGWLAWMSGGYIKDKPVDKHVKRDILDIVDENLESPLPDGDEQDPDDEVADDTKFTAEEASEMFQILDAKRWTAEQRKVLAKEFGMDWEENVILNDAVVATIGAEGIDSDTASAGSPHSSRPLKKSQGEAFTGSSREALPLPASMSYAKPNASRAKSIEEDEKIPPPTSSKQMHDISAHFEVTRVSILLMDYKRQPFADFSVSGAIVSYHATKDTFAAHMTLREFHVVDASIPNSRPIISAAADRAIAPHPLCPRQNMFALKFGKLDKVLGNGIDYDISFGSAPLDVCFMVPWMQQVVSFWGENSGLSDVKKLHQQQQNAQNANSTPLVQLLMKVERQKISNLGCSLHGLRLIIPEARRSRDSDSVFVKQECAIEVPLLTLQNDPKFSLERRSVLQKVRAKLRATEFPERITLLLYPEGVEASHYTNNFFIAIKDLRISTSYLDPTVRPPKKPEILSHYILARASLDLTLTNLMVKDNTDVPGTSIDISSTNELCIEGPRKMWLVLLNAVTLLLEFNGNKNGTGSKLVEQGKVFKRGESGEPFHARVIGPRQRFIHADEDIRPLNQQLQEVPVADQDRYVLVHYGSMVIYHAERPSMPFLQLELKQHAVTVVAHKLAESDMKRNRIHKDYIYYDEEEDENGEALKGRVHAVTVFVHSGGAEHHHRKGLFEARALLQKHNIPLFNSLPQQHQAVEFVTSVLNSARKLSQYEVSQIHEAYAIVQRSFHTNPCDAVTFVFTTEAEQAKFAAEVQKHASPDGFVAPPMEFLSYRGELAPPLPKQNQRSMNLNINIPGARISIVEPPLEMSDGSGTLSAPLVSSLEVGEKINISFFLTMFKRSLTLSADTITLYAPSAKYFRSYEKNSVAANGHPIPEAEGNAVAEEEAAGLKKDVNDLVRRLSTQRGSDVYSHAAAVVKDLLGKFLANDSGASGSDTSCSKGPAVPPPPACAIGTGGITPQERPLDGSFRSAVSNATGTTHDGGFHHQRASSRLPHDFGSFAFDQSVAELLGGAEDIGTVGGGGVGANSSGKLNSPLLSAAPIVKFSLINFFHEHGSRRRGVDETDKEIDRTTHFQDIAAADLHAQQTATTTSPAISPRLGHHHARTESMTTLFNANRFGTTSPGPLSSLIPVTRHTAGSSSSIAASAMLNAAQQQASASQHFTQQFKARMNNEYERLWAGRAAASRAVLEDGVCDLRPVFRVHYPPSNAKEDESEDDDTSSSNDEPDATCFITFIGSWLPRITPMMRIISNTDVSLSLDEPLLHAFELFFDLMDALTMKNVGMTTVFGCKFADDRLLPMRRFSKVRMAAGGAFEDRFLARDDYLAMNGILSPSEVPRGEQYPQMIPSFNAESLTDGICIDLDFRRRFVLETCHDYSQIAARPAQPLPLPPDRQAASATQVAQANAVNSAVGINAAGGDGVASPLSNTVVSNSDGAADSVSGGESSEAASLQNAFLSRLPHGVSSKHHPVVRLIAEKGVMIRWRNSGAANQTKLVARRPYLMVHKYVGRNQDLPAMKFPSGWQHQDRLLPQGQHGALYEVLAMPKARAGNVSETTFVGKTSSSSKSQSQPKQGDPLPLGDGSLTFEFKIVYKPSNMAMQDWALLASTSGSQITDPKEVLTSRAASSNINTTGYMFTHYLTLLCDNLALNYVQTTLWPLLEHFTNGFITRSAYITGRGQLSLASPLADRQWSWKRVYAHNDKVAAAMDGLCARQQFPSNNPNTPKPSPSTGHWHGNTPNPLEDLTCFPQSGAGRSDPSIVPPYVLNLLHQSIELRNVDAILPFHEDHCANILARADSIAMWSDIKEIQQTAARDISGLDYSGLAAPASADCATCFKMSFDGMRMWVATDPSLSYLPQQTSTQQQAAHSNQQHASGSTAPPRSVRVAAHAKTLWELSPNLSQSALPHMRTTSSIGAHSHSWGKRGIHPHHHDRVLSGSSTPPIPLSGSSENVQHLHHSITSSADGHFPVPIGGVVTNAKGMPVTGASAPVMHERLPSAVPLHIHVGSDVMDPNHHRSQSEPALSNATSFARYPMTVAGYAAATDGYNGPATPTFHNGSNANQYPKSIISPPTKGDVVRPRTKTVIIDDPSASFRHEHNSLHSPDGDLASSPLGGGTNESVVNNFPANFSTCLLGLTTVPTVTSIVHNPDGTKRYVCKLTATTRDMTEVVSGMRCEFSITWEMNNPHQRLSEKHMNLQYGDFMFHGSSKQMAAVCDWVCGCFMEPYVSLYPAKYQNPKAFVVWSQWIERHHPDIFKAYSPQPGAMTGVGAATRVLSPMSSRPSGEWTIGAERMCLHLIDPETKIRAARITEGGAGGGSGAGSVGRRRAPSRAPAGSNASPSSASSPGSGRAQQPEVPVGPTIVRDPINICIDITKGALMNIKWMRDGSFRSRYSFGAISGWDLTVGALRSSTKGNSKFIDSVREVVTSRRRFLRIEHNAPWKLRLDEAEGMLPSPTGNTNNNDEEPPEPKSPSSPTTSSKQSYPASQLATRSKAQLGPNVAAPAGAPKVKSRSFGDGGLGFDPTTAGLDVFYGYTVGGPDQKVVYMDLTVDSLDLQLIPRFAVDVKDSLMGLTLRNSMAPMFKWPCYSIGETPKPADPNAQQWRSENNIKVGAVYFVLLEDPRARKPLPLYFMTLRGITFTNASDALGANKCLTFTVTDISSNGIVSDRDKVFPIVARQTPENEEQRRIKNLIEVKKDKNGLKGVVGCLWFVSPLKDRLFKLKAAASHPSMSELSWLSTYAEERSALLLQNTSANTTAGSPKEPPKPLTAEDNIFIVVHNPRLIIAEHSSIETANKTGIIINFGLIEIGKAVVFGNNINGNSSQQAGTGLNYKAVFSRFNVSSLHSVDHYLLQPSDITAEALVSADGLTTTAAIDIQKMHIDVAQEYYELVLHSAARHLVADEDNLISKREAQAAQLSSAGSTKHSDSEYSKANTTAPGISLRTIDHQTGEIRRRLMSLRKRKTTSAAALNASMSQSLLVALPLENLSATVRWESLRLRVHSEDVAVFVSVADMKVSYANSKPKLPEGLLPAATIPVSKDAEGQETLLVLRPPSGSMAEAAMNGSLPDEDDRDGEDRSPFVRHLVTVGSRMPDTSGALMTVVPASSMNVEGSIGRLEVGVEGGPPLISLSAPKEDSIRFSSTDYKMVVDADTGALKCTLEHSTVIQAVTFLYEPYRRIVLPRYGVAQILNYSHWLYDISHRLVLSSRTVAHFSSAEYNHITLNCGGNEVHLIDGSAPILLLEPGLTVVISNAKLHLYGHPIEHYASTANGSYIIVDDTCEVIVPVKPEEGTSTGSDEDLLTDGTDEEYDPEAGLNEHEAFDAKTAPPSAFLLSDPNTTAATSISSTASPSQLSPTQKGPSFARKSSKKRMIHGPESPAFARGNTDSPPPPSVTTVTLSDTANSSQAVFTLQSQVPLLLPKKFQPTSRQIDAKGSVELALPEIVAAGTQFFSKAKRALSVKMQLIVGHGQTLTPDVEETGSLSKEGIDAFYSVGDPLPPDDGGLLTSPTRSNGGGLQSIKVPTIIMSVSEQACAFLKDMYAECEYFTKNSHVRSDFSTLLTPWEVRMTVIGSDAPIPTNTETALDLAATYGPASTTAGTSISAAISAAASTAAPPRVMRRKVFIEADRRVDFRLRYGDITLVTSSVDQLKRAVGHIEQQVLGAAPADQHGFEHLSRDSEEQQQKAAAKVSALTVVTNVKQIVLFVVDDSMFGANTDVPLMSISISNILTPVLEFSAYATKIHASAELDIEYYNINTGAWSPLLEPVEFDFVLRSNKNVTLEDVVSRKGNRKAGVHMRSMNFHATPVLAQVIARLLQLKNRLKESNDPTAIANAAATAAAAAAATPTLTSPSATTAAVKKPTGANSTTVSFGGDLSSPTTKETNAFSAYTVTQQLGHNIEIEFCDANGLRRAEISHKKLHSQESISFDYPRDLSDTRDGSKDHPIAEHCINVIIRRGDTVTGGPDEDDEELVTTQSTDGSSQSVGHPTPEFSFGKATIWLARVGTSCINVGLPTKPRYIVVEVLVNQGTKKIMLRTNVSFTNKLPFGVTFRQIGCIQPGTKVTVPRETLRKRCSFLPTVPGGAPDEISMGVSYDALHNFFAQQFLCTARIPRTSNRVNSSATNRARSDTFMPDDEIQQAHHIVLNFDPLKAIPYSDILDCHATLEAPFNIVNNTGQPLHVTFHYRKLFAKKSFFRSDEYHFPMIDKIAVDTEECYPVTQVDPFLDLYISVQMSQPTGDSLASRSKSKTCVLVRSVQSSDDRASYIKLVDTRGEELELRITYRGKDIVLDCPFWVVNQTEHYIQITTTSIKRRQNCVVAGMSGDGLGPLVSTPFLIHTPKMKKDPIDAHLYVRVGRHTSSGELMWSQWSDKVFINAIGEMSVITCGANGECISLSYSVAFAGGKLKETRVVKITPRWIIINRCKHPLIIRQNTGREDTPISVQQQSRKSTDGPQLTPGLLRVLDTCTVSNGPNLITIKHGEGRSVFSAPISIDRLGDHALNIRYVASVFDKEHQTMVSIEKSYVVHVTCYARASTLFISIDEPEKPPHLIENRTRFQLHVRQRDTANQVSIYRLRTSGFVWEDAQAPKVLQMWISENTASSKAVSINLDPSMLVKREHQLSQVIRTNGGIDLYVRVRAFGGSYAISVTEDDRIDRARILPFHQYKYQMQIDSVNLLMADAGGDILLLTLGHKSGLKASITQGRLKEGESDEQVIELSCGIIQLADERPETTQRVVLQNINRPSTVRICRRLQRMTPMLQIAAFEVALQPITIHLTDSFIYVAYNLYERFTEAIGRSERAVKQSDFATTPWYLELSTPITSQDSVQNRVAFVEKLSISQLTVSFSLYRNDGDDDLIGDRFGFVSLLIRSVNDARFDWRRIDYDNIYDRLWLLATFLSNYYSVELQRQLLNVVHVAGLDVMRGFVTDLLEGYFASTAPVSIGKSAALVPLRDEIKFRQDTNERKDDEAHPVQQVAIRQMTVRQRGSTGGKLDSHLSGHSGYKEVRVGGLLGRTEKISMEQYADRVSFADFVANVTKQEFKVFGHLAVRRYLRTRDFTVSPILLCNRCIDIETMRDNHAEGNYNSVLPHPNSRHISWAELAHHASWEEMTELCAAEELVIHAETLKSGLAGTPTNVVRIDATMAANIRQTTRSETVGGQPARTGAASLDDNDAA